MNITVKDLLDAGVHFGHQKRRWNPKSRPFVYDHRNGISIIDLEKTYECLQAATAFVEELVASGKDILFIATKRQAQDTMREAAKACNMPYAVNRWMGGGLTNFATIKNSLEKYRRYLRMEADGSLAKMIKKEAAAIKREMSRMHRNFEGMIEVRALPGAVFVIDTKSEAIAVNEASRLDIPTIGLVDTNSDPSKLTYPIPGNDDAVKSVRLIVEAITEAIQAGLARREVERAVRRTVTPIRQESEQSAQPEVTIDPALLRDATDEDTEDGDASAKPKAKPVRKPAGSKTTTKAAKKE
ncbi:MAG: 30S ribosomal protein S2 [Puniceicoccales bacterium]|jgi:small subunit ribosomal protein S2|nr:30S ribosomal protein S2 [Puniceicoccales bacterium]